MQRFLNSELPIDERVEDLISQLTLEEKISQMVHDALAVERIGLPAYNWWNEGLHGVGRAGVATVFPQAIGMAATWNPELMHKMATVVSDEARAIHHEALRRGIRQIYTGLTFWSPNINIFRDPRWGRGQETFGEDPYLTASLGVAFIRGLQGDDPHYLKLVATPKHFAAHSGPESSRHWFDAQVDEKDLRETYLPHFEACIREGGARSIMGAYNRLNGEACCASQTLLQDTLRKEWGFDGYVVSDCMAIHDIHANHKLVETAEEAAALAVEKGCELNCGSTYAALLAAVEQGLISEETIDLALKRLFTARFLLGMFDPPDQVPYSGIPYEVINCEQHQALALQVARESLVLLKNEGNLLPLSKDVESIAVIGPNADDVTSLLGNYNGTPLRASTPLAGIRAKVSTASKVYYARGCTIAKGLPPLQAIPPDHLFPADGSESVKGLTATYYDNPWFEGAPVLERVDCNVDFVWKQTNPLTGCWGDDFSARWTGFLVPPASGNHRIGVNGFSKYKLYLDDELAVAYEDIHHSRVRTKDVLLEAGRFHKIRLDFVSTGLDPQVQLLWSSMDSDYQAQALEVAARADVIVAVMGLSSHLEGEDMPVEVEGFSGGDRTDIKLPAPQEELLKAICELNKPTVLVLLNGSALALGAAAEDIPTIVEAWYPGEAGGNALADVLFGDFNPAGRLPITFYRSMEDLPPFDDYQMANRTYRYFQGQPLFPFGFGLSYTDFQFENLSIDPLQAEAGENVTISVDVTNIGDRSGDEVVQLYTRQFASPPRPIKELKGFKRVSLEPGACKTIVFTLHTNQLSVYDEMMPTAVIPGKVEVMVGSSSENLPLKSVFKIIGSAKDVSDEKVFFSQVRVLGPAD
jgi:beta-glucosidase